MADEFVPFPAEQGWQYGSVLPLAQRPIPYANALQPQLAVPGIIRDPINAIASMLQIPGQAARGELGQQPEQLMGPATRFAEGALAAGLVGSSLAGVPENSFGAMMGYHGTPYRFEPVEHNPFGEFRQEAIGTGEGVAAYGYGHYVAGARPTAEDYRSKLSDKQFIKKVKDTYDQDFAPEEAEAALFENKDLASHEIDLLHALKKDGWLGFDYPHQAVSAALREPESFDLSPETKHALDNFGSLYHIEIKPEEHELLDWDKPLSEQSPQVQDKLNKAEWLTQPQISGSSLYKALANAHGSAAGPDKASASRVLHEAGIPGIKYLDQFSRNAPEGQPKTSNYVIFHPSNLKIIGRNGEVLVPQELSSEEAGGRINRALLDIHSREASELGYGRRDAAAISPAQQKIDQMMRQHKIEAVDYNPFAKGGF